MKIAVFMNHQMVLENVNHCTTCMKKLKKIILSSVSKNTFFNKGIIFAHLIMYVKH